MFLFFATMATAFAQGTARLVVPGGLANVEGNSAMSDLFTTDTVDMVQVFSASEFGFLAGQIGRIDGVAFRLDGATSQTFVGLRSVSVYMSTTLRSPDSLSTYIYDNTGNDGGLVFGGTIGVVATSTSGVRPFDVRIPFATP